MSLSRKRKIDMSMFDVVSLFCSFIRLSCKTLLAYLPADSTGGIRLSSAVVGIM